MKILRALLLQLLIPALVAETKANPVELKWVEKQFYTVSQTGGSLPGVVKVNVATPDLTGYAGFFSRSSADTAVIKGIRTAGVTPGRIDAWETDEVAVPSKFIAAALEVKEPWRQSLQLVQNFRGAGNTLTRSGNSVCIVLPTEKKEPLTIVPDKEWTGFELRCCATSAAKNRLPVVYRRYAGPPREKEATAFLGLLHLESGRITEVFALSNNWAPRELMWIDGQTIAMTDWGRYSEFGAVADLTRKQITAGQSIPGAARWLIWDGGLFAWPLQPGPIPVRPLSD